MRKVIFCIFLSFAVLFCTPHASAYRLFTEDRPYTTISLDTNSTLKYLVHEDFGATTFSHMNEALYQWNKTSGYPLMQRNPTVRHSLSDFGDNANHDTLNLVYRKRDSDDYIGLNLIRTTDRSSCIIVESDINFNIRYSFANSAMANRYDAFSIFLHETGHTVGLSDIYNPRSYETDSVMIGDWSNRMNSTSWRSLRQDDINGVKVLYP